ncbi:MAG: hypothetical protein GY797_10350 [Deltaproteobacteria bacterium]|nr:hypothetical protein [Deltaproteobacteria bacterium]
MKIDIRILTCDRTRKSDKGVNYIHTTIVNFLSAGGSNNNPVSLYVSHSETTFVDTYSDKFKIIPADSEVNGNQNFIRACTEPSSSELILVLEDDLEFSSDFVQKLTFWLDRNNQHLKNNLVTLYTPYIEINRCLDEGKDMWKYPIDAFYGTQALLGSRKLFQECGESIRGVHGMLWDMAIKEWMKATGRGLVSTVPCFVQHIGVISSLHGQDMHTTSGFLK